MNEQRDDPGRRPRLNLTTSQVAASALAACCASIVASYLGLAGTVIGAAVGSVVATTGAAVYGQLFRHGGARIRRSLLINGRAPQDAADAGRAADAADAGAGAGAAADVTVHGPVPSRATRTGRFYSASREDAMPDETRAAVPGGGTTAKFWLPASSTVEQTRVSVGEPTVIAGGRIATDEATRRAQSGALGTDAGHPGDAAGQASARPRRIGAATTIRRYRRPVGVLASVIAVFCVSISVGFLLGGPARASASNSAPPPSSTTYAHHTRGGGNSSDGNAGEGRGRGFNPAPSTSSSPTATPSTTASPSDTGTPANTQGASPPAGTGATGTGGTGTGTGGGATGAPTRQPLGGATDPTLKAP